MKNPNEQVIVSEDNRKPLKKSDEFKESQPATIHTELDVTINDHSENQLLEYGYSNVSLSKLMQYSKRY